MYKHTLWWLIITAANGQECILSTPYLNKALEAAQELRPFYGPRTARIKLQRRTTYGHFRPYPEV